jgi:uncharacterized protein YjdB
MLVLLTACVDKKCTDTLVDPAPDPCAAESVKIVPSSLTMPVLATSTLAAEVTLVAKASEICGQAFVEWTSGNSSVATVTNVLGQQGAVTAISPGDVGISATTGSSNSRDRRVATISVRVVALVPTVRLSANALTLAPTQNGSVAASVVDQDNRDVTSRATITWASSNETVATVDRTSGGITAVAKGATTITATAVVAGGTASATLSLTVADPPVRPVASLTIIGPTVVRSTETIALEAKAVDASGAVVADPTLSWQSSAPSKATVSRTAANAHVADVLGVLVGRVVVTATAASGKTATLDVDVVPGPLASIVVTPFENTLRAGKTAQLAASARDANGNAIPGQSFSWSSATPTLASVDASGLVTAIAAGMPDIRVGATGTTVSTRADVTVLPRRVAYALADQPQVASYAAPASASFNSAGGAVTITRQTTGVYRVAFPGQQPRAGETETFMVSPYGTSNGYCKIASWGNGAGTDLVADVRCFAFGGIAGDSPFTISLVSDDALGNRFAFALSDQLAPATAYTPLNAYNRSLGGSAPVRIARLAVGKYAVTFTGNAGGGSDPEGIIVTPYGTGNERCQPASELAGETVLVNCWVGAAVSSESVAADSRFTIALSDRGRGSGQSAGFAFIDDAVVIANGGSMLVPPFSAHNSTTRPVRVQRRGAGVFDVTLTELATGQSGARFIAHASDMDEDDSAYCTVSGWTVLGTDLVVTVTCWHEEDGTPDDDAFYLFVIQ